MSRAAVTTEQATRTSPGVRRALLVCHLVCALGWLGAALAYIGLTARLLTLDDPRSVAAGYLAMQSLVWTVLLPLAVAALLTGVAQALLSPWGLTRYYWVIAKLSLTVFGVLVLLDYTQEMRLHADVAAKASISAADAQLLTGSNHLLHAIGGVVLLTGLTVLAVYKPGGMTRSARRRRAARQRAAA